MSGGGNVAKGKWVAIVVVAAGVTAAVVGYIVRPVKPPLPATTQPDVVEPATGGQ